MPTVKGEIYRANWGVIQNNHTIRFYYEGTKAAEDSVTGTNPSYEVTLETGKIYDVTLQQEGQSEATACPNSCRVTATSLVDGMHFRKGCTKLPEENRE